MEARMPNWERGVENILFAIQEFRKLKPGLDWGKLILIGHSNGGDMVMLFAARHPLLVDKAISLDHRRMKMPRIRKPRLYTLRGCDYEADEGVLPGIKEQEEFHMRVVKLEGVTHSGMGGAERRNSTSWSIGLYLSLSSEVRIARWWRDAQGRDFPRRSGLVLLK